MGVTTIYEEGPAVSIRTKKSFSLWPSWNFDVQSTRNKKFFEESFRWWWTFKSLNRFPYQGEIDFEFLIIITGSCSSKRPPKIVGPRNNAWVDDKIQFVNLQFQVAYLSNSIMHNHLSTPYLAFRLPSIKLSILFFRLFKIFGHEEPAKMNLAWSG